MSKPTSENKKLQWKNLIEQQRQSGLSINTWCLQNQIGRYTFYYWQDKLFPKQLQKSSFTKLDVKNTEAIVLQTRGICIRIGRDCDPHLRKELFTLFGGLPC